MAISGPRTHHHDDDAAEAGPAVFSDINITPLTDIFLVLLIIFMVTSTALVEAGQGGAGAGVRVDLPKGAAKELQTAARDFTVAILKDGSTVIDGKIVDEQVLRARFEQLHKDSPEAQVIIQADTGVQHGKVVEVMEVAKAIGIDRLAIATDAGGKRARQLLESAAIPRRFRDALLERTIVPVNPPVLRAQSLLPPNVSICRTPLLPT